eukprot:TRINITY_DN63543_c0_g1_i1.p1 TRINITY_DN63543_c0_g1~~TRINITY_DN63543_c0_g1_i1.p1  ORF type:complete len:885 (+),score=316.92 TRINITY_DN63543_c0_g1_i1:71-2725(+)
MGYAAHNQQFQQQQFAQQGNTVANATKFAVTGCSHPTVGPTVRGSYSLAAENHGRRAYKRDAMVNGLDVMIYFWDERDGPNFCGWWFGPKIGGDRVWAYHPDKAAQTPPLNGWKVPYDGPVDASFQISLQAVAPPQQHFQQHHLARQRQVEEQRRRLEDQKRMQEEQNRRRMEEVRKRQEQQQSKQQELEQRRKEQMAAQAVRKVIQKLRLVTPANFDTLKAELAEIQAKELDKCGAMKEAVQKEAHAGLKAAEEKLVQIQEALKKAEEQKVIDAQKAREQQAVCEERMKELSVILASAEEAFAGFKTKASPFLENGDVSLEEMEAMATVADTAGSEAKSKAKECSDFVSQKSSELKEPARKVAEKDAAKANGEKKEEETPKKPSLRELLAKVNALVSGVENSLHKVAAGKMKATKKAHAKAKLKTSRASVGKYDKDGDGFLSKKEALAYVKGELRFTLQSADLDSFFQAYDGKKGVPVEFSHRLKAFVGIVRERARDATLREKRLAREKEVAERKAELQTTIDKAKEASDAAAAAVKSLEEAANPLPVKAKSSTAAELTALAAEAETRAASAKKAVEEAQSAAAGVASELPELQSFGTAEAAKLKGAATKLEARITRCEGLVSKSREDATEKDAKELSALRAKALKLVRQYQSEKKLNAEKTFEEVDKNKDGRVDEAEFKSFMSGSVCSAAEDAKADKAIGEEDLSRLFKYLDEESEGTIAKEHFMPFIRLYMKVVKETAMTSEVGIKGGKTVRRLELNETCEVLEGPVKEDDVGLERLRVRMLRDDADGWVSPVGNQGTAFLKEAALRMKVVKDTILTPTIEVDSTKETSKRLKVGDVVDVREWMRKEDASGLMRMKVRTADGKTGWATALGNAGAKFLEEV